MRIPGTHRAVLPSKLRGHLDIPAGYRPATNYVKAAQSKRVDPRAWERRLAAKMDPVNLPPEEILTWSPLQMPRGLMSTALTTVDVRRIVRVVRRPK